MAKFVWRKPPSKAWKASVYKAALMRAVYLQLLGYAPRIEIDMKRNASWMDRTSTARQTLASFVYILGDLVILVAKQQVDYGKWLELRHQGRYAIVLPTLQRHYAPVWDAVKQVVE